MGKTAFALSILANIYRTVPSLFFSLEMSIEDIGKRLLSQISGIDGNKLRSGFLTHENHNTIIEKSISIIGSNLYLVDAQGIQLGEITSESRRLVREKGIRIIFIDYIGLVKVSGTSQMHSWENTAEITRSLKMLARELKIPVVALCQVSRDSEGKEPTLANLRGSGSVEQDADLVLSIQREESNDDVQDAKLKIAKHRNGETGSVNISFYSRIARFEAKKQEVTNGRF